MSIGPESHAGEAAFASAVRQHAGLEPSSRPLLVAEVAQAHDGSLGTAHAFIDAVADSGADAIKFQTHIARAETTRREEWRVRFSRQDPSRYDYWERMEFSPDQWAGLKEHCDERGLIFLSSAFSIEAVDLLRSVGVPTWKVASGEITNTAMVDAMAATGLPMILSSGMSSWAELGAVVDRLAPTNQLCVLQCTSSYPCPAERIGINNLEELRHRTGQAVGLSDHSSTIFPGLAAVTMGASVVEVHVTLSRHMFGPDVSSSLTVEELTTLATGIEFVHTMLTHPVDKDEVAEAMAPMRRLFTKSVVAAHPIAEGTTLTESDLAFKKPGDGIPTDRAHELIGRRAAVALAPDDLITPDNTVSG